MIKNTIAASLSAFLNKSTSILSILASKAYFDGALVYIYIYIYIYIYYIYTYICTYIHIR